MITEPTVEIPLNPHDWEKAMEAQHWMASSPICDEDEMPERDDSPFEPTLNLPNHKPK